MASDPWLVEGSLVYTLMPDPKRSSTQVNRVWAHFHGAPGVSPEEVRDTAVRCAASLNQLLAAERDGTALAPALFTQIFRRGERDSAPLRIDALQHQELLGFERHPNEVLAGALRLARIPFEDVARITIDLEAGERRTRVVYSDEREVNREEYK